jgi:hypothetical protein
MGGDTEHRESDEGEVLWDIESPVPARAPGNFNSNATASKVVADHSLGSSIVATSSVGVNTNVGAQMKLYVAVIEAGNLVVEPGVMVRILESQFHKWNCLSPSSVACTLYCALLLNKLHTHLCLHG